MAGLTDAGEPRQQPDRGRIRAEWSYSQDRHTFSGVVEAIRLYCCTTRHALISLSTLYLFIILSLAYLIVGYLIDHTSAEFISCILGKSLLPIVLWHYYNILPDRPFAFHSGS